MTSKYYITRNLKSLNQKYLRSKTQAEPLYYSKLAIIEICGWIESSLDELFYNYSSSALESSNYINKMHNRIKETYGFSQNKHLKPLVVSVVGYSGLEKLESSCDQSLLGGLYRNLDELTKMRNELAHTYIKGFAVTIESPQLILRRLDHVANGLDELERKLAAMS